MLELSLVKAVALALIAVSSSAALFLALLATRSKHPRAEFLRKLPMLLFLSAVLFLAMFLYALESVSPLVQPITPTPSFTGETGQALARARVIESKTEEFARELTPIECEETPDLVYWRELRVYNVTTVDVRGRLRTAYYSTITLNIGNKGVRTAYNVLVRERIPSSVALTPEELLNFTKTPLRIEKGSVVVEWLFDKIEPGQNKSVSYSVEKKLSKEVLKDFETPKAIAQAVEAGASPTPLVVVQRQAAVEVVDWSPVGIITLIAVMITLTYFFSRKTRVA